MLKLIICDDELTIRKSINTLIDWNSLGIEVIGTCQNGIETYNMILDENPNIVLTDIQMPGMSGLELIERVYNANLNTTFIILTGFSKFEYAKQAMKYGVKHYLLKPCNEKLIVESIKEVIKSYYSNQASKPITEYNKKLTENLHISILSNIINELIFLDNSVKDILTPYTGFMDFYNEPYEMCYFHYVEEIKYLNVLEKIYDYFSNIAPNTTVYSVYVKNTLIIFFKVFQLNSPNFNKSISTIDVESVYNHLTFSNLSSLLQALIKKIKRYSIIYFMNGLKPIPTCNYNNLITTIELLTNKLTTTNNNEIFEEIISLINDVTNPDFLKQTGSRILIKLSTESTYVSSLDITKYLVELNQETDINTIRDMLIVKLNDVLKDNSNLQNQYSSFILKIMEYVDEHLSDSNLTLKYIADNHLFMNVDYLSKCFNKETKQKFSNYITNLRVQKAKELLSDGNSEQIKWIAQQVGCGNNPQYFSQIFKKNTGMTPSAYAKKVNGNK